MGCTSSKEARRSGLESSLTTADERSSVALGREARRQMLDQTQSLRFQAIRDEFTSIDQVQRALRKNGLESSELIVGIDFTKSNEWQGQRTFQNKCLHDTSTGSNPYIDAFQIISRTLSAFDDDERIPCYGFGDATTHADSVFSFYHDDVSCDGFEAALQRYKQLLPHVKMSGPTSFGPIIRQAMRVVKDSGNRYHILLIIADGEITRSVDLTANQLSTFEKDTIDAIVAASMLPLSIVMVGVGDGPWDQMREFDDRLPQRNFDNFQFVEFHRIMADLVPAGRDAQFALRALMEVPEQYAAILQQRLLDPCAGRRISLNDIPKPKNPPVSEVVLQSTLETRRTPPATAVASAAGPDPAASTSVPAIPDEMMLCPITQDLMQDPVLAEDGYTYDRAAIEKWFRDHTTSPMTNELLGAKTLIPNNALRSRIFELYPTAGS